jgi:PAS domain S-box-containing protein
VRGGNVREPRGNPEPSARQLTAECAMGSPPDLQPLAAADEPRSAELLQLIFDHAGEGICVFDAALRLTAWNDRFLGFTGLDRSQVHRGDGLQDLLDTLARAGEFGDTDLEGQVRQLMAEARTTTSMRLHRRPNGRSYELRRNMTPDGGFVMLCADVTERIASEAALVDQQRMLALLLERTEQGFWFIDNALGTTNANPAMCRMLGLPLGQLLGRDIYDFVDERNAAIFREHVRLRALGQAEGYEITLRRADGVEVHCYNNATPIFDAAGRKIGAVGLFSDISALRHAEQQLRQAGDRLAQESRVLAAALDSLVQGVMSVDPAGRIINHNRRLLELLELPEALIQSRPTLSELARYQLEQGHFGSEAYVTLPSSGQERKLGEIGANHTLAPKYQRTRRDGAVLEVQTHFSDDGSVVRTYTDVTASVTAQQALIAAKEEAERANRAKSEFLSRMSHELRTPLNAVLGFAQLMEADAADPLSPSQRGRVRELMRGGRHLLSLINEVLDLATIEAGTLQLHLEPVELAAVVDDCLRMVQPMALERGIALESRLGVVGTGKVLADPTRLKQVLLNLLSNGIKYNRSGGSVRLACQLEGQGSEAPGPTSVRIDISDDGPGLTVAQQHKLFQAFERLHPEHNEVEGTGIGLALSKWLVELMRGEIGVRSAPGQGSTFWVRLACAAHHVVAGPAPGPEPAMAPMPPAPSADRTGRTVLYIEDNLVNQLLMEGMLQHRPNIRLLMADHPVDGLSMAARHPPDLVLLDIQLPDMDGFEVMRRLRQQPDTHRVPVIAVSANAMQSDIDEATRAGFADYLTKTLDLAQLLSAVDRTLAS